MDLIVSIFSGAQAHMLIAFSKVKERAICQCNHRISSSSPSISKRPELSVFRYANPCCSSLMR